MPGSGVPSTGVSKVREKLGSLALFASNPIQYWPAARLPAEIVPEKPSLLSSVSLPTVLQDPATPPEKR